MIKTRRLVVSAGLLMLVIAGMYTPVRANTNPTCSSSQSPLWQVCGPVETTNGLGFQPSALQNHDGSISLAWTADHDAAGRPTSNYNILYTTRYLNGTWKDPVNLVVQLGDSQNPALAQLLNGTVYVFYSYKPPTSTHYQIYYRASRGATWSGYTPLVNNPAGLNDTSPTATVTKDGTLFLVWSRDNSTLAGSTPVMRQLWYKTLKGNVWSQEANMTLASDQNWNWQPSLTVGRDNVVRLAFVRGVSGTYQVYYATFNGAGWSSASSIVSTAGSLNPSLVQDRNGTFYVFWSRAVVVSTNLDYLIFSKSSVDNGVTWSASESQLSVSSCSGTPLQCVDNEDPAAVQSTTDRDLWVFYSSNPSITSFNIWALKSVSPISPVHDVAILNSRGSWGTNASLVCGGYQGACDYAGGFNNPYGPIFLSPIVQFYVTINNTGDFNETVTVAMSATNTTSIPLGSQTVPLPTGSSILITFNFNTTGVKPARYGFTANATIPVESLGNRGDNGLSVANIVHLFPLGDVDQDGSDTLTDVSVVFYNYGFGCTAPGVCSPRYNPWADPSGRGIINLVDVGVVSKNFDIFT